MTDAQHAAAYEQQTKDFNEAIAKMLGFRFIEPKDRDNPKDWIFSYWENKDGVILWDEGLTFDIDWEYLMNAVEFVESLEYDSHGFMGVHITANSCTIQGTNLNLSPENYRPAYFYEQHASNKITAVFLAIGYFATLYNSGSFGDVKNKK